MEANREAVTILEIGSPHSDRKYRSETARAYLLLGTLMRDNRQWPESPYRQALAVLEPLVKEFPDVREYRALLAGAYSGLGIVFKSAGRPEAEPNSQGGEIARRASRRFPGAMHYHADLLWYPINLGNRLADSGKRDEAEAAFARAVTLRERLSAQFPAWPEYRTDLASSYFCLAHNIRSAIDAIALLRKAVALGTCRCGIARCARKPPRAGCHPTGSGKPSF